MGCGVRHFYLQTLAKNNKSTTVDWALRESLRILVRRTLQRNKYPPDKAAEAVGLVLTQAERLSEGWSMG